MNGKKPKQLRNSCEIIWYEMNEKITKYQHFKY